MQREVGSGISSGAYCFIAGKLAIFVPVDNLNNFDSDNSTIKSDFTTLRSVNLFFMHTFNGKAVIRLYIKRYLVIGKPDCDYTTFLTETFNLIITLTVLFL